MADIKKYVSNIFLRTIFLISFIEIGVRRFGMFHCEIKIYYWQRRSSFLNKKRNLIYDVLLGIKMDLVDADAKRITGDDTEEQGLNIPMTFHSLFGVLLET